MRLTLPLVSTPLIDAVALNRLPHGLHPVGLDLRSGILVCTVKHNHNEACDYHHDDECDGHADVVCGVLCHGRLRQRWQDSGLCEPLLRQRQLQLACVSPYFKQISTRLTCRPADTGCRSGYSSTGTGCAAESSSTTTITQAPTTTTTSAAPTSTTCAVTADCTNSVPDFANRYCDNGVCSFRACPLQRSGML